MARGTAQPGSIVRLFEGTTRVGTDEADPQSGAWRMVVGEAPEGPHSYRAKAADSAGNVSAGTTIAVPATMSYDPGRKKATLNPSAKLAKGTKYTVTVTTGAKRVCEKYDPAPASPVTSSARGYPSGCS